MKKLGSIATVLDSSFLYDTKAMYETDQNRFLNAVCRVETDLSPTDFLLACKKIEKDMGREKTYRWGRWGIVTFSMGPRIIDLDILFYGNDVVHIDKVEGLDNLVIPHERLQERGFVLKPLCDIAPGCRGGCE